MIVRMLTGATRRSKVSAMSKPRFPVTRPRRSYELWEFFALAFYVVAFVSFGVIILASFGVFDLSWRQGVSWQLRGLTFYLLAHVVSTDD